ncbi:hypothetical protein [Robiginitomaculum antarcticum]|uniref:hypothetical protein n=1 Tax=Robiginitomaculum antarcticum TaxID=437507 RepID=UPI00037AD07D|nr:hypothetical protein [Robiginitomaculum antarcticum]
MKRGLVLVILCLWAPLARAGAWPYDKGTGQIITTTVYAQADTQFDETGEPSIDAEFRKFDTSIYWEHGLSDRWTIILQPTYQNVAFETTAGPEDYSGFGPTELALRRTLWRNEKTIVSAQGGVIFAGGGENIPDRALGIGGTDYEARLLLGRSLMMGSRRGFAEAQFGYRVRSEGLPDEWRLDATLGFRLVESVQIMGQIFAIQSQPAIFPQREYFSVKGQASIVWDRAANRSYQLGLYQTLAGETIVKETGLVFSIWQRY